MNAITDLPKEILEQVFELLVEPQSAESKGPKSVKLTPPEQNPFEKSVKNSITPFLNYRLVSKLFKQIADRHNRSQFVSLLPTIRNIMVNFHDVEAIKQRKTSELFAKLVKWIEVKQQRVVVPLLIDKIFLTDADKQIAKKLFDSMIYIQVGLTQTIAIPVPDNNNSYVVLQSYFQYQEESQMGQAMAAAIFEFKHKKATGEVRTCQEIYDDFITDNEQKINLMKILAVNNGRIVNGVYQVMIDTLNTVVTALGCPQWRVEFEGEGDWKSDAPPADYCVPRLLLALFGFHRLALEYTSDGEIELMHGGGSMFGQETDNNFAIIDDCIAEVLPAGPTPSLAQLTHELKTAINSHVIKFDSHERALQYYTQMRSAINAYWCMNILRVKNRKHFLAVHDRMQSNFAPEFTREMYLDLFTKMEWFKLDRTYGELIRTRSHVVLYGIFSQFGYAIKFNDKQTLVVKVDQFVGNDICVSLMVRGIGFKSLESHSESAVPIFLNIDSSYTKRCCSVFDNEGVLEEVKLLMGLDAAVPSETVIQILVTLPREFARTEISWFGICHPSSVQNYFLSQSLDDSDSSAEGMEFNDSENSDD